MNIQRTPTMTTFERQEKDKLIVSLLEKSFLIFLHHAQYLLEDDRLNQLLLSTGNPVEVTPAEATNCQWVIKLGEQNDQYYWCKNYELSVNYKYNDDLTLQSLYGLGHDIRSDELHFHRRYTRIACLDDDGEPNYAEYIYESDYTEDQVQTIQLVPF